MKKEKKAIKTSARNEGYRGKLSERQKSKCDKSPELRVLILEDNPADAELMEHQLLKAGIAFVSQRVDTRGGFLRALKSYRPQLILADYSLPKFDALQALELAREKQPLTPFIVVTGSIGEEKAVAVLRAGADDYLLKDRLARLAEAVRHALANHQLRSEKMAAEESLRANELLHHAFIDSSSDMAFLKDEKFRHLLANKELCRFYKKEEKEIIGKTDAELLDKSAAARCRRTDRQALTKNRVHVSQETIGDLTFETRKFPVKLGDNRIGVGGYIRDISEGERAKEALQAAAARWRTTFDSMNDAVCLLDAKGAVQQCNRAMNRLLGLPFQKIIGKDCLSLVCGAGRKRTCAFHRVLKDHQRHEEVTYWRERWFQVTVDPVVDGANRAIGAVHIMTDITEAEKAKKELRESEERFRGLYENATIGMYRTTPDGRIVMANQALVRMLGYASFADLMTRDLEKEGFEPQYPRRQFSELLRKHGQVIGLESAWNRNDGTVIHVRESAVTVKAANGDILYYDGTVEDISERKQAEEKLRMTSRRLELALDSAKAGAWDWNVDSGEIEWSPQMFALFGLDSRTSAASFATWKSVLHPEDMEIAGRRIEQALEQHANLDSDYRVRLPDGQLRWINAQGVGVYDAAGRPVQMIGICQDISERKHAQEQTLASLHEKEILLKEIHHRVKNNLQVISGLLSLQAAHIDDERLLRVIKESQSRIWTMALIHQTLYQSGNLASIDMADYIRSLTGNLLSAHAQVAMPPTLLYDLEPLHLFIDKAIPLALIVNELVTNAMKHAFPDGRAGEIRISLHERRGTARRAPTDVECAPAFELTVTDNGIGLPSGFDPQNLKSLGLQLVAMLARQLGGTLAIESPGGASVRISFTLDENNKTQN